MNKFLSLLRSGRIAGTRVGLLGSGETPVADWRILLVICALVNVTVIVYGVYSYVQVYAGNSNSTEVTVSRKSDMDTQAMSAVVKTFEVRQKTFSGLVSTPPNVLDPSL
jgi:hypothetical protein